MNNLTTQLNAANRPAIAETNFQKLDASEAFMELPTVDPGTGVANILIGPPTAGTWIIGQIWRDSLLAKWRCTVAGSPGTWIQVLPAIVAAQPAGAPDQYLIQNTAAAWKLQYWDAGGSAWTNV
ncbi:MAG: hypothetical protein P4N60_11275 [Verrucomicrobiae bacterium]|nr:hypothetical protein [Verrucomicrobiae bacterium]